MNHQVEIGFTCEHPLFAECCKGCGHYSCPDCGLYWDEGAEGSNDVAIIYEERDAWFYYSAWNPLDEIEGSFDTKEKAIQDAELLGYYVSKRENEPPILPNEEWYSGPI